MASLRQRPRHLGAGDVKGGGLLHPHLIHDFQIVYANVVEGKQLTIETDCALLCFTDPQLGGVG